MALFLEQVLINKTNYQDFGQKKALFRPVSSIPPQTPPAENNRFYLCGNLRG